MHSLAFSFVVFLSLGLSACGDGDETRRRGSGASLPPGSGAQEPLPLPGESPGTGTSATNVTGNTFFDLVGPALPVGATVIPLRATLVSSSGQSITVTSVHLESQVAPTPVSAGTYALTFLDENDAPTGFTQSVTVQQSISNRLPIGSVYIDPASAVQTDRVATVSFPYAISSTEGTLKVVVPNLATVVDLPPRAFSWQGIGSTGFIPPVVIDAGSALLTREWGSVLVLKNSTDRIAIYSSNGSVIFPETIDGVEYLLPATPQNQGCMVYLGVINNLTTRTITLCSDANLHVILNER